MKRLLIGAFLLDFMIQAPCAFAQLNEQTKAEIRAMEWRPATGTRLLTSNSVVTNLPSYQAIIGAQAVRVQQILGNETGGVEGYLANFAAGSEAILSYIPTGYVKTDDWSRVDPVQFLSQLVSQTETANTNRISRGISPIHVDGWVQQPTLNQETHTVSWVLLDHSDTGEKGLNAVALKLGRLGTERITFVDNAANVSAAVPNLLVLAASHQFLPGSRYEDYVAGNDKAAEYGIAGLVAGVMGVKLVQVAAAAGAFALLKKLGFLLLLPVVWIWRKASRKKPVVASKPRIEPTV